MAFEIEILQVNNLIKDIAKYSFLTAFATLLGITALNVIEFSIPLVLFVMTFAVLHVITIFLLRHVKHLLRRYEVLSQRDADQHNQTEVDWNQNGF